MITYIDYYIPAQAYPVHDLIECIDSCSIPPVFAGKNEYKAFIDDILQLNSIRVENELTGVEMIMLLLKKLFDTGIDPLQIDMIMMVQEPRYHTIKNPGHYLQHIFKMESASILHISGNQCANIEMALNLAQHLITADRKINNLLIVSSLKHASPADRVIGTYALEGDAAGIMLLQKGNTGVKLLDTHILINGLLHDANLHTDNSLLHCKYYIKCLREILKNNNANNNSIDYVLIQNANKLLIGQCIAAAGIDPAKIYLNNYGKYGHLDCLDFLVNLKDVIDGAAPGKGKILAFGTGWAGTYISSLLTCQ